MPELTAPMVFKNDEKRIVYGPVLVPDEPDSDGDVVTVEQIEKVAHKFVEDYGNIDLQHSLNNVGKMIESYITPVDLEVEEGITVPKGSWMMGVKVTDDSTWQAVKNKELTGFSIMGIQSAVQKSNKSNQAVKRTTLEDLGEDWIVNAVSLVDEPAVPKAKWIAIKNKAKETLREEITDETVQKAIAGSVEERGRLIRDKVYATFDTETTDSYVHSTFEDTVVVEIHDYSTGNEKLIQFTYEIDDEGNVNFLDEGQEVIIEETVVPVNDQEGDNMTFVLNSKSEKSEQIADESFMSKIKKKLGFTQTEKAGRTISEANLEKLKAAKEVIDELLSLGESERSSNKFLNGGESEVKKEEVEQLVEKSVAPLKDQINELMNTLKSGESTEQAESEEEQADNATKETVEEKSKKSKKTKEEQSETEDQKTVSKSEYDKVLEELEKIKKNRPFSKRLSGQDDLSDGNAEKSETKDRDAFGFKRKK